MSGNSGVVGQDAFMCEFQYFPGIHPKGTPASMAGARVKLPWNEAVVQEGKGWGKLIVGSRPHHRRPHLMEKVGRLGTSTATGGSVGVESLKTGARADPDINPNPRTNTIAQTNIAEMLGSEVMVHLTSNNGHDVDADHIDADAAVAAATARMDKLKLLVGEEKSIGEQGARGGAMKDKSVEHGASTSSKNHYKYNKSKMPPTSSPSGPPTADKKLPTEDHNLDAAAGRAPFAAAKELNDTIGGLIHAREIFKRRVARFSGGSATSASTSNNKHVLKIGKDSLFIGDVENAKVTTTTTSSASTSSKRPHGEGVLIIDATNYSKNKGGGDPGATLITRTNTQHIGRFEHGRAHGDGVFLSSAGLVLLGKWEENKRVGEFRCLDATGQWWLEKYNREGKKVARKKIPSSSSTAASTTTAGADQGDSVVELKQDEATKTTLLAAQQCAKCSSRFHAEYNHSLACRVHVANFVRGEGEDGNLGIWTCCGSRDPNDSGCNFGRHVAEVVV
ncbi:unnamed protein product [Amoebophrya sp. A25]|nr:unnamed protein product [Amoebophrya sp. A25]|eukprot:GSA25T00007228001.1